MNDDYVKVEGNSNLIKDKSTGVILNIDKNGLAAAKRRKQLMKEQQEERETVLELKSELSELKKLIGELLEQKSI
jgi:malate/lactate dehydrogenase